MAVSSTGVVVVDHNFQAITHRFVVKFTSNTRIKGLKIKVQETYNDLNRFDIADITVWKTKGQMTLRTLPSKCMAELLGSINVNNTHHIQVLADEAKVRNLGLSEDETLVVQVPAENGPVRDLEEYKHCFLRAHSKRLTEYDVELNGIFDAADGEAPQFVKEYENILSRKRNATPNMRNVAEMLFDKKTLKKYFCSTAESGSSPTVSRPEIYHLNHIMSVDPQWWDAINPHSAGDFKGCDSHWLFFNAVAKYYGTLTSTAELTVKRTVASWPFNLLVKVGKELYTYSPKGDFVALKFQLPRLAVQVNSHPRNKDPVDLYRLMLQGASVVRFANTMLDAFKQEKTFVFVAIYISSTGHVQRYLLYQNKNADPNKVYWKRRTFKLANARGRLRFALELYNFPFALHADEDDEDTRGHVNRLTDVVNQISSKNCLLAFTSNNWGDQPGSNCSLTSNDGADEQLEVSGYEVVPDDLEADGGTWRLIDKPPPNIRIVYRRRDPNKTEYIAKHARKGSNELAIYKYLHTRRSQSPHVVSLIEAIPSTTREWLILPKLLPIRDQWFTNSGGVAGRVLLGWGLIKGLAYLHEHKIAHRDIKPDNLVRDHDFLLKIIDFDVAIKVQDENTEIDEYRGTEGWTAPEMGTGDSPTPMYSPIKADRWSCGRVILRHIMVGVVGKGDHRLWTFASQLMVKDPLQRPSLLDWHNLPPSPVSKMTIVSDDRYRQDDGERVRPPNAKKPRLERSDL